MTFWWPLDGSRLTLGHFGTTFGRCLDDLWTTFRQLVSRQLAEPKSTHFFTRNWSRKWSESCPKVIKKSPNSGPKVVQNSPKGHQKVAQNALESHPEVDQKSIKSHPQKMRKTWCVTSEKFAEFAKWTYAKCASAHFFHWTKNCKKSLKLAKIDASETSADNSVQHSGNDCHVMNDKGETHHYTWKIRPSKFESSKNRWSVFFGPENVRHSKIDDDVKCDENFAKHWGGPGGGGDCGGGGVQA